MAVLRDEPSGKNDPENGDAAPLSDPRRKRIRDLYSTKKD
jgi:hypothetical protein